MADEKTAASRNGSTPAQLAAKRRRARGEGTIRKRADGTFEARVSDGYDSRGRRKRTSVYGKTRTECMDALRAAQQRIRSGEESTKTAAASTFFEMWLASSRTRRASSTYGTYEVSVRLYLAPWLRKRPLASLKAAEVEAFYCELAERGIGARTIAKAHATLRAALGYALKTELVTRNVAALIEPPKYAPKEKPVLTIEQTRAFLAACEGHPGGGLFALAIFSQLREGELLALRWSDLDLDAHTVRVERTLQDDEDGRPKVGSSTKTRAGRRVVLLPAVAVALLERHQERTGGRGDGLVFPSETGTALSRQNVLQRWLYPLLEAAELPRVTFHGLRHTGASLLWDENLKVLSTRIGHSSIKTTADVYQHLPVAAQKPLADRLDSLFKLPSIGGGNGGVSPKPQCR
jgi:integrase